MHTVGVGIIVSALAVAMASPASAALRVFSGTFSGTQEVAPNASPGGGIVVVTWDNVAMTIRIQTTFSGLLAPATAAHLHCCAAVGASAIPATMVPTLSGFPLGVTSGSSDTPTPLDLFAASTYNPAFIAANGGTANLARIALVSGLRSNRAYFNIHTSAFPGGEIRAQLTAVPEPATWGMMILGFALLGKALRARRTSVAFVGHR